VYSSNCKRKINESERQNTPGVESRVMNTAFFLAVLRRSGRAFCKLWAARFTAGSGTWRRRLPRRQSRVIGRRPSPDAITPVVESSSRQLDTFKAHHSGTQQEDRGQRQFQSIAGNRTFDKGAHGRSKRVARAWLARRSARYFIISDYNGLVFAARGPKAPSIMAARQDAKHRTGDPGSSPEGKNSFSSNKWAQLRGRDPSKPSN